MWNDIIKIHSFDTQLNDNESNEPLIQLKERSDEIKNSLDKNGIYLKNDEFKYSGQNGFFSVLFRPDVIDGDILSFKDEQFWKIDNNEKFAGIADIVNQKVITTGLIEISNFAERNYKNGCYLFAERDGVITDKISSVVIGKYLFDNIIFISINMPEYINIRKSKLDNPICNILSKNNIVETGVGSLLWERNTQETFINDYNESIIVDIDTPIHKNVGWFIKNDIVKIPYKYNFSLPFSFLCKLYIEDLSISENDRFIFSLPVNDDNLINLFLDKNGDKFKFEFCDIILEFLIPENTNNFSLCCFYDGSKININLNNMFENALTPTIKPSINIDDYIIIGKNLNGYISDFKIYDFVINSFEIKYLSEK